MAEEFQAAVYSGSWWSSPIPTFNGSSFRGSYGSCSQNNFMNFKTSSTEESSGCFTTAMSPDSAFQITGSSPSTTTNWYEALLINGRSGETYNDQTLPEILNSLPEGGDNTSNIGMDQEQSSNFMSGDCTGYPTSLLQTLFDGTSSPPPPSMQPLCDSQANSNDFSSVFWNASGLDMNDNRAGFFSPNVKSGNEEIRDLGSLVKKSCSESTFKRPRIETPSPLPTFKVRKEKLGDRVTALQQLVSPFGKTDTASVLHEAIEYIKHLHDQVNVLSNPYMKNGATMHVQQINNNNEGAKQQGLRSRGLCLVPVSSTFPVATETTPEYWTSGFRSTFNQ